MTAGLTTHHDTFAFWPTPPPPFRPADLGLFACGSEVIVSDCEGRGIADRRRINRHSHRPQARHETMMPSIAHGFYFYFYETFRLSEGPCLTRRLAHPSFPGPGVIHPAWNTSGSRDAIVLACWLGIAARATLARLGNSVPQRPTIILVATGSKQGIA
jgi:hypothetical protein